MGGDGGERGGGGGEGGREEGNHSARLLMFISLTPLYSPKIIGLGLPRRGLESTPGQLCAH